MHYFTWDEVSRHNKINDCWIVVDGAIYEITHWIKHHPGGDAICALAGEDVSAIFHSGHLKNISSGLMDACKIGEVAGYAPAFNSINDEFLVTLKGRVLLHFKAHGINFRDTRKNRHSILVSSLLLIACWLCMYFLPPWGGLAAVPMGLVTCSLIGSFGHEQIHGNLESRRGFFGALGNDFLWGLLIPFMPRNYFQYEHLKHHNHPMHPEHDYDVYALKELVRLTPRTPWKSQHAHQHVYAPFVYGSYIALQLLAGYTTTFFDARELLKEKHAILHIIAASITALTFHIVIPMLITSVGWTLLCASMYFFVWQAAIYISSGLPHMVMPIPHQVNTDSWARYVCETTANLKCGNKFFDWLTGGLNYHLIHHLLPTIPREHLSEVKGIVETTCLEYGYPCRNYDSFRAYYRDHYRILIGLGRATGSVHP